MRRLHEAVGECKRAFPPPTVPSPATSPAESERWRALMDQNIEIDARVRGLESEQSRQLMLIKTAEGETMNLTTTASRLQADVRELGSRVGKVGAVVDRDVASLADKCEVLEVQLKRAITSVSELQAVTGSQEPLRRDNIQARRSIAIIVDCSDPLWLTRISCQAQLAQNNSVLSQVSAFHTRFFCTLIHFSNNECPCRCRHSSG